MPATITAEERALIDAKVAAGKVTRCATGASAAEIEYIWCSKINRLVPKDKERATALYRGSMQKHFARRKAQPTPEQTKRRQTVAAMIDAGQNGAEIARTLGVNVQTVYSDAKIMGRKLARPLTRPVLTERVANRRAEVAKLAKKGMTAREIAARIGCRPHQVWDDAARLGIKFDKKATHRHRPGPAPKHEVAARRKKLQALLPKGMTSYQLADALGVSRSVVFHDCASLGLSIPSQRSKKAAA